jgi:glycosyltransferase involved in cell wall biosynthesis
VSYVHSPIRYAWDLQHQYLAEAGLVKGLKSAIARLILHYMRLWDTRTANGVDAFVANSRFVGRRIAKAYGREATVVYPPVDIERFALRAQKENFYLTASRMVPYKKIPLIVQAFAGMPDKRLVVIGEGPEFDKVKAAATPNVEVLGYKSTPELIDHMQRARAFVFAAEEDFGITPVEAQACGTPVIAYGKGGSLETVRGQPGDPGRTGTFFREQSVEAIQAAVREFEAAAEAFSPRACRAHAVSFAPERFQAQLRGVVEKAWERFCGPA